MGSRQELAEALYIKGNDYRRKGEWHLAMNCYSEAAELDADSPASEAQAMLQRILDYRCTDYYNP